MSLRIDPKDVRKTFLSAATNPTLVRKLHEVAGILPERLCFALETCTLEDARNTAEAIRIIQINSGYSESQVAALMLAVGRAQESQQRELDEKVSKNAVDADPFEIRNL